VGIVRISGPAVPDISNALIGKLPEPRHALLAEIKDEQGELIDTGIALYFPAPHSFTGEHVLELQGHGGMHVLQQLVRRILALGARTARPGEFSERAYLNDKMDLVQAEAIADLIESGSDAATRAAQRSLQGEFSRQINGLRDELTSLRVFVEAAIDFPDEEIDFLAESDIIQRVRLTQDHMTDLLHRASQGVLLRDGIVLAIIGRPNAGKSSLLNALSGQDSAIVTALPGTTRDVLREQISLDGIPVHLADTAGIRETSDLIEAEGIRRARQALGAADIVLLVRDASEIDDTGDQLLSEVPTGVVALVVANKIDKLPAQMASHAMEQDAGKQVWISAKTGQGIETLKRRIRDAVGATEQAEGSFSARQRHVDALQRANKHLETGCDAMEQHQAGELLAEELRLAQQALGEITGQTLPDDLLGEIFSSFCIGK
jgi:tRNA modification GTPase